MNVTTRIAALTLTLCALCAVGCRAQAQPSLKDDFRRLIMQDRKASELQPQPISETDVGNTRVERIRFTPEQGHSAVVLINRPKAEGKHPTIIVQHYLGASKDHPLLLPLYNGLAQKGFLVAAIDGRYRGERQNGKSLDAAMVESLRTGKGKPFLVDTAYDVLRLVDYLQTRPDVDPNRMGMTGLSEGGIITWMCAAADERIKVAVPIIGVTAFGETLSSSDEVQNQPRLKLLDAVLKEHAKDLGEKEVNGRVLKSAWDKLVPGMLDRFDAPHVVPLIAPRPLLIVSHEADELFPIEGARRVFSSAKARYQEMKAEERIEMRVGPGLKHGALFFPGIVGMMEWFERWLKAPTN